MNLLRNRPVTVSARRGEAVVLGGSMAGLLAAAVLAEHFEHVTVVERDRLDGAGARRGVPQARHIHVLLPRGGRALDQLFPGFCDQLVADGARTSRNLNRLHLEFGGHLMSQEDMEGYPVYAQSRAFLEAHVRARVEALPNVTALDQHDVVDLAWRPSDDRVVGASVVARGRPEDDRPREKRQLDADVVVVATGRNGRVPAWLGARGFPVPPEEELRVDLMYASRLMRLDPALVGDIDLAVVSASPTRPVGVAVLAQENESWIVSVEGFAGHHPPTDPDAWTACAVGLAPAGFAEAIAAGQPLSDVNAHRFPSNLRRRYDKLDRFPEGLLVTGDAVCSFNPIYGQGMTVAALEALALRDTLRRGTERLAPRFFKAAAKPVNVAWQGAVGADLSMPADLVPGPRPLLVRAVNAYMDRYQAAAENDPVLAWHFLNVTGFDEPTRALFGPSSLRHLLTQRWRRQPPAAVPASA